MSDCLITTLKGTVDDAALPFMGEINLEVNGTSTSTDKSTFASIAINCGEAFKVVMHGGLGYKVVNAVITDESGTEFSFAAGAGAVAVDNNVTSITIRARYSVKSFSIGRSNFVNHRITITNDALKYQPLTSAHVEPARGIGYSGGIAEFISQHPNLSTCEYICYTAERIPVSTFLALKNVTVLRLNGSNLSGSIDELYSMDTVNILGAMVMLNGDLSGDLAKLPVNLKNFEGSSSSSVWTWGERSSDGWPIAMFSVKLGSYIDKALIDMAACKQNPLSGYISKTMTLIGTRTSASDDAVATLQSKGWTITVTPES